MLIPLSWLKDYVDIKLPLKDLMWKMTEAGLTCESYKKVGDEIILDVEVTANRPDWMSIVGVAREVAAVQGIKVKIKEPKELAKPEKVLPIKLNTDPSIFDRWTGVVLTNVEVKESPKWIKDRLTLMGARPINNIVDITNYVMYEYGVPMHAFDYDEIKGAEMTAKKSKGGETFTSVDSLTYKLPKDAMVIYDKERLIDLAGIKGGLNSGIRSTTKNIFLHVTIDNPVLTRRSSIALGLRSEASAIYERGPDKGGTVRVLRRAVELLSDIAGAKISSKLIDIKKNSFEPWNIELSFEKLNKILGIVIEPKRVLEILEKLNLSPKKTKSGVVCTIPTYRGDIKIEEDLIEEVARIYGYNNFPKTLPSGLVAKTKVPYYFDDRFHNKIREIMTANGYSEVMTLSLISADLIKNSNGDINNHIKISNPVSSDYEYMRSSLIPSLLPSLRINQEEIVKIFEIDKVYLGNANKPQEEYRLSAIVKGLTFREFKGVIDSLLDLLKIKNYEIDFETNDGFLHPSKSGVVKSGKNILGSFGEIHPSVAENFSLKNEVYVLEFIVSNLEKSVGQITFNPVAETPPQIEDLTLSLPSKTRVGDVIQTISREDKKIIRVELVDIYKDAYTLRIWYQDSEKTLADNEVEQIRNKVLKILKSKFGINQKN